jgi:leader peptidase (prepilin peptidase)/N-methyltransferase
MSSSTPLGHALAIYGADFALVMALVAAAFIDLEHLFLPDSITIGGSIVGLLTAPLRGVPFFESLGAGLAGFVVPWFFFGIVASAILKKKAFGMGDAKLLMLAGTWLGIPGPLFALVAGSFQGVVATVLVYLFRGQIDEPASIKAEREELQRLAAEGDAEAKEILAEDPVYAHKQPNKRLFGTMLPFGPFLILAILEYLFAGPRILAWVEAYVLDPLVTLIGRMT